MSTSAIVEKSVRPQQSLDHFRASLLDIVKSRPVQKGQGPGVQVCCWRSQRRRPAGWAGFCARSAEVRMNAATPSTGMSRVRGGEMGSDKAAGSLRYCSGSQWLVVPVGPRNTSAVLAGLGHHGGHGFPSRTITLQVFGVRQVQSWRAGRSSPVAQSIAGRLWPHASRCRGSYPGVMQGSVYGGRNLPRHWVLRGQPCADRAAGAADSVEARDVLGLAPTACRRATAEDTMLTPSTTCASSCAG